LVIIIKINGILNFIYILRRALKSGLAIRDHLKDDNYFNNTRSRMPNMRMKIISISDLLLVEGHIDPTDYNLGTFLLQILPFILKETFWNTVGCIMTLLRVQYQREYTVGMNGGRLKLPVPL
jgi:hypothetical protein